MNDSRPLICYVTGETDGGGDGRHVLELARRLDRDCFRVGVVSHDGPGDTAAELERLQIPVHRLELAEDPVGPARPWWRFVALVQLRSLLAKLQPTLVHCVGFRGSLLGRLAARMVGVPWVVSTLRRPAGPSGLEALVARATAGSADVTLALGRSMERLARSSWGIHPARIEMVDPGVDLVRVENWPPDEQLRGSGPVIGTVGSLHRDKGVDVLLRATRLLSVTHPGLRLIVAGGGPEGLPLLGLSRRLGLQDRVMLLGQRPDVGRVLAALDAFILPARRCGVPFALLEAAGARRPIIASDIPGIRDFIDDDVHGLLVPSGFPGPLAAAIDRVLRHPDVAARLGHAARARVRAHHRAHDMFARCLAVYERLLAAPAPSAVR